MWTQVQPALHVLLFLLGAPLLLQGVPLPTNPSAQRFKTHFENSQPPSKPPLLNGVPFSRNPINRSIQRLRLKGSPLSLNPSTQTHQIFRSPLRIQADTNFEAHLQEISTPPPSIITEKSFHSELNNNTKTEKEYSATRRKNKTLETIVDNNLLPCLPLSLEEHDSRIRGEPFSTEVNRKKVQIILVILCFSLVGAFILTLVNVSHDLQEIRTFYKGFMGRKLLLSEQLLLHRQKENEVEKTPVVNYIQLEPWKQEICLDLLSPSSRQIPAAAPGPGPLRYIEDDEPEWRSLDYSVEVCPPPPTFCSFLLQYDLGIFSWDSLTQDQCQRRKNLIAQFRRWKKRKRKNFSIVVTERVRREMSDQEESKNKKRQGGGRAPR